MKCVVEKLSKDYSYSNKCEKYIGELLYEHNIAPNPHLYSEGCEPKWDIMYNDIFNTKVEIKIQSDEDMCFEISKIKTSAPCGIYTTESTLYVMINRYISNELGDVGMLRVLHVDDILQYIEAQGDNLKLKKSHNEWVKFIDPKKGIPHINIGYFPSLDYGEMYDLSCFKLL